MPVRVMEVPPTYDPEAGEIVNGPAAEAEKNQNAAPVAKPVIRNTTNSRCFEGHLRLHRLRCPIIVLNLSISGLV